MNPAKRSKAMVALALGAGLMDAATGAALVVAPAFVLAGLRVPSVGPETVVFLRWIGIFVGAVGLAYLWALLRGGVGPLRDAFAFTALVRALVGGFVAFEVIRGGLAPGWSLVAVTDLGLAALQRWFLATEDRIHV
jgi:hypothetical protein